MAFMMPVVKNDYNIYASSCPGSSNGSGSRQQSRMSSLSTSPAAASFMSSPRNSHTPAFSRTAKSELSLHRFHSKVLDKLRKVFRSKDDSGSSEDIHQQPSGSSVVIR